MKKTLFFLIVSVVLLAFASSAFAVEIDTPSDGGTITSKPATFSGTSRANSEISLKEDGTEIATTSADGDGNWSLETSNISSGEHEYTATETYNSEWAFMNPSTNDGKIDVVDVADQSFADSIELPDPYVVNDVEVWDDDYVLILGSDYADNLCQVFVYDSRTLEPIPDDDMMIEDDCEASNFDPANEGAPYMSVLYYNPNSSLYSIVVFDLDSHEAIDGVTPDNVFDYPINTVMLGDGSFIINYHDGIVKYTFDSPNYEVDSQTSQAHNAASTAVLLYGDGYMIYGDEDGNIVERQTSNIQIYSEHDLGTDSAIFVVGARHNNGAFYGMGYDDSQYRIWEWSTGDNQVVNNTGFSQYPESFAVTPDDTKWVIGDDHSAGFIYFGETGGDEITGTIAHDGSSYNMSTDRWIAPEQEHTANAIITTTNTFLSGNTVANSFGTNPNGGIGSKTVSPGDSFDVSGSGYEPNSAITITLHSTPVQLKTLQASSSGAFSTNITIPSNTSLGSHTLVIDGTALGGGTASSVLSLNVVELASTGNNGRSNAMLAMSLIMAGCVLAMSTKKRIIHL